MSATLQVIHSGSAANGYILTCGDDKMIIEAGCKPKEYLEALKYDITQVEGILCSHGHTDHSRSIKALQDKYGLQVYAPRSVCDIYPKCHQAEHMKRYSIGGFRVLSLRVPHGDCECMSYHITMPDGQTLLFITDAETFPYNIKGINHLMIECNNSQELIVNRLCEGQDIRGLFHSHMELSETINVINRLKSPALNKCVLIHLSDANSDARLFKDRILAETGVRCDIAENNLSVCLDDDF